MFQVDNFRIVKGFHRHRITSSVRYWDKAATEGGGAFSSGVLMHRLRNGVFVIEDVRRGHWRSGKREAIIHQTAELDGQHVAVWVEQEGGSGGKESAESTIRNLAGFIVRADRVTGSKETRAEPYSVQVENGNVLLLRGEWNREFLDQHEHFPVGKYKDDVDAAAGAFNKLVFLKIAGTWGSKR
jgi:predicted phage terminase large subunit-like protein